MTKIKYINHNFRDRSALVLIADCNHIITEYTQQNYDLTLRQLYYQLVARDLFPDNRRWSWNGQKWQKDDQGTKNAEPNYTWLSKTITYARNAGMVSWEAIVDRTRNRSLQATWDNPLNILNDAYKQYKIDMWD